MGRQLHCSRCVHQEALSHLTRKLARLKAFEQDSKLPTVVHAHASAGGLGTVQWIGPHLCSLVCNLGSP